MRLKIIIDKIKLEMIIKDEVRDIRKTITILIIIITINHQDLEEEETIHNVEIKELGVQKILVYK